MTPAPGLVEQYTVPGLGVVATSFLYSAFLRAITAVMSLFRTRDGNGGKSKSLKVGVRGPKDRRLFFLIKAMKTPFSGTLYCFKQPLTKYSLLCFKAFFQR